MTDTQLTFCAAAAAASVMYIVNGHHIPTGCKSYQMAEDACDLDPVEPYNGAVSCETNVDAFHNFDDLTLHST
jgi:hypothetical protein